LFYRVAFATQGAGHFDGDGEPAADPGLVTGAAGEVGFAALTTGAGFGGAGFTGLAEEIGFAGPPRGVCFTGAARGVCFLTPPIALWAEAGRQRALPNAAAIKIIASALFFMGPSPDVLTQTIRYAAYTSYTNYCRE
jgi:alkylation response protein AidB-like acyl-CoA dehydrogenase